MKNLKQLLSLCFAAILVLSSCASRFDTIKKGQDFKVKADEALKYYENKSYSEAQQLFEDVMPFVRGTKDAEKYSWLYANCSYNMKEYLSASYYFKTFASNFPNSEYTEDAAYMSAVALGKLAPNSKLDQEYTLKAIEAYQLFTNTYPNSKKVEECNKAIDISRVVLYQKDFDAAELYYKVADYKAATHVFKSLLQKYPDAPDADKARFMIVKSCYYLAQNSVEDKQAERYRETLVAYRDFVDKHSDSPLAKDAEKIFDASNKRLKAL